MDLQRMSITGLAEGLRQHQKKAREGYSDDDPNLTPDQKKILGIGASVFAVLLVIGLIIWIWAIVVLVKYWHVLPAWAQIVGVLGILPVIPIGPIVTLIVVYIGKNAGK
mgnify:FL=1